MVFSENLLSFLLVLIWVTENGVGIGLMILGVFLCFGFLMIWGLDHGLIWGVGSCELLMQGRTLGCTQANATILKIIIN